ncbi:hypothetical protein ES703_11327 [subsurface metagenome]
MRTKEDILNDLMEHAKRLDPQHYDLAAVAIIKTEIQIDIRDILDHQLGQLNKDP